MRLEYNWDFKVATYDADKNRRLKLSSALRLQQDIGERHLESLDLPYTKLYEAGMVFVIARARTVYTRPPLLSQPLRLTTWSRGTKGMLFNRCYSFTDENGGRLIDSQAGFALMDPASHRLRRPSDFNFFYDRHDPARAGFCPEPEKLLPGGEMLFAGLRPVRFSDLDFNGHMNNSVYADIICDFIPGGMGERLIKELQINFIREAVEGETLEIFTSERGGTVQMCAKKGEVTVFTAEISFF